MLRQEIFQNFRGLNRTSDRLNAPPDFLFDLLNGYIAKDVKSNLGVIKQRSGSEKFNSVVIPAGESIDAYTKLLIHFDGSDEATSYTAETGQTVTFAGTAQLDTAQKKFGASALLLDGNSDYASVPDNDNLDLGSSDFTIESWIRWNSSVPDDQVIIGKWGSGLQSYYLERSSGNLVFGYFQTTEKLITAAWTPVADTWYHVAAVRNSGTVTLYVNGTSIGSGSISGAIDSDTGALTIGSLDTVPNGCFSGWIDEVRISKGTARWTANFTVPALAYAYYGFGTTKKIRCTFEPKWDGGSTDVIIRAGTAWGKYNSESDTFDAIDYERADDALGQCVMFKNELIMVDGGKPRKMTAAGVVADLSSDSDMPDKSDCVWVHRDKVWLNDTDTPMIAYFCTTNSANGATSWSGSTDAGTIDLSTVLPEGDRIRGFRTYGGADSGLIALICDKYTVIYSAGANTYSFTFVQYFPTTCLSMNACTYVGGDLVYPSRNELTSLFSSQRNNELETRPLSNYINNLWREYVSQVTTSQQISAVFNHSLNHYYITFPITGNFQTLVYSADIGNFVGRWNYPFEIYSWCERLSGVILAGGDGYVYTINTGTNDDGTAISFKAAMPALYFKDVARYKKPADFEALFYAANADPEINLDYWYGGVGTFTVDKITKTIALAAGATLYYWDESTWDSAYWADVSASFLYRTSDILGRGRFMVVEISHSTKDALLVIGYFKIGYVLEGAV